MHVLFSFPIRLTSSTYIIKLSKLIMSKVFKEVEILCVDIHTDMLLILHIYTWYKCILMSWYIS